MNSTKLIGITPFELPDLNLLEGLSETSIFPVLHVGRNPDKIASYYTHISTYSPKTIGLCFSESFIPKESLPSCVACVIIPMGLSIPTEFQDVEVIYQVTSLDEAHEAKKREAKTIIIKGNESGGKVATESTFILFQRIKQDEMLNDLNLWVQGGIGIHTSSAFISLGASALVLDNQFALFAACSAPKALKEIFEKLNGNETKLIDNFRILTRPSSPRLPNNANHQDILPYLQGYDLEKGYLPIGQDITLSKDLIGRYKNLQDLAIGLQHSIEGHLKQAKHAPIICENGPLAKSLNIRYPIAQGPMTRVSDVPAFAEAVSEEGALPFVALSLMTGEKAKSLLEETSKALQGKTWGVGILGFAPSELREEQSSYIMEFRPPVVLIAGGRPSQAAPFEKAGIKTFLHVPSAGLLDLFIKEGSKKFIFEGRECGGHVGPLSSLVLWEQQIERILQEEHLQEFELFFAGGIHDSFSSAFVSIMTAPLAIRGAKIGVLMGTAYIYTKEAVDSGAILPGFQKQALNQSATILLETAPGHETRCLESPFTLFFEQEKQRLHTLGKDKKEIWRILEQLNVGRLRIASKGLERRDDELLRLDEDAQHQKGMYMIGQVAALKNSIKTIKDLHEEVGQSAKHITYTKTNIIKRSEKETLDIAIIGMACIFPGAQDIDAFWQNILEGKDCITEVPDERWNKDIYYDANDTNGRKSPSKWGGFIPKISFDPLEFGIPPQSLAAIDPTQLLSLLVAKRALENAGYASKNANNENVSVIIGAEGGNDLANNYGFRALFPQIFGEIPKDIDDALPKLTEDSFPGVLANVIAGRITNRLDLGGRNYTVDAACASSLAAIDLACQELTLKKSDMVIAGAADLHNGINDYLMFASTHALSKKGKCATFDMEADGIALGEGIAMVVLKRLQDAQRDGDKVFAVIKGVGGSSDGKSLGLTAPRLSGQTRALERAYTQANISPASVELIEAHGTGTVVGDRTELSALSQVMMKNGALPTQTHLGSVKTQIGHTKCAAGMAGLIKSALSVYYGIKPPTINLKQPNTYYEPQTSPFKFTDKPGLWLANKRIAGVSAFGFGGTNFHAVITNAPSNEISPFSITKQWPTELFVFRGHDKQEAHLLLHQIKQLLELNDSLKLRDIAFSLVSYNNAPIQLSILADSIQDLSVKIDMAVSGVNAKDIYYTQAIDGKTAFLFSGQGSQRIHMARDLFVNFPAMRTILNQYPTYENILFPDQSFGEHELKEQQARIKDTKMAQPLLGMVDLAIAKLLAQLGIIPDMLAGHSYGELPALCFAGVFDENKLVALSEGRAEAILTSIQNDHGAMVAINADEDTIEKLLQNRTDLYAVNHNAPHQWVLAGETAVIQTFMQELKELKISYRQLEVACAFHSPLIKDAEHLYSDFLASVPFSKANLPVWSNTTAAIYPREPDQIKKRLTTHIVSPVRFSEQITAMYQNGARIFIEVGPGKTLTGLTKSILGKDEILLNTEEKGKKGITQLLTVLAQYIATGKTPLLTRLFDDRDVTLLDLDQPEKLKKGVSTWLVNGQMATPLYGKLPAYSAEPITTPIVNFKTLQTQMASSTQVAVSGSAEQLTLEYLANMNALIQAQRDVLLTYLGQGNSVPYASAVISPVQPNLAVSQHISASALPAIEISKETNVNISNDIKTILLDIVSKKTGYPIEMLGMDLDLEADLSIDSIKRMEIIGELRNHLSDFELKEERQDEMMEQLATLKTLNGLVSWFDNITPSKQGFPSETLVNQHIQVNDVENLLLDIVSEKTGYPKEMLGLDLDLEADLSIDSIKRIEIIGELKTKLTSLFLNDQEEHENIEQLSGFKTLRNLINWMANNLGSQPSAELKTSNNLVEQISIDPRLKRIKFELTDVQSLSDQEYPNTIRGKRIAITRDGKLGELIKLALEEKGASVDIIGQHSDLYGYDGLIILDLMASNHRLNIIEAVRMVKTLDMERVKWIYVLSDHDAHIEHNSDPKFLRAYQGYTGFIKSLDKEYEQAKCRAIHFMQAFDEEKIPSLLINELLCTDSPSVIYYKDKDRKTIKETNEPLFIENKKPFALKKDAVVLVLGGAQGITAALTTHLAGEYPCRYILVGRSPHPAAENLPSLNTKEEIRKHLIKSGFSKLPIEIERRTTEIYKAQQIAATIEAIKLVGGEASYYSVDVRDEDKLVELIQRIYRQYGRIDGVIHGAGILEDKLFQHKTPDSFERVFSTKVTPLRVLAEQLKDDTQFIVFFSSIASVYGNKGQTDYAAANSVLDHYADALRRKMTGRILAINWGPWKGAGMVSSSLEKEYAKRGISLIPLESGKEIFTNEIKYGEESRVLIMA